MAGKARRALILLAAALAAAVVAPYAHASGRQVIRDCSEDGVLNGKYSQGELQDALHNLPSDLDEYTDCRAIIRAAQLAAARRGHGKVGRGPSAAASSGPPTADEQRRVDEATHSPGAVKVGGLRVEPGATAAPLKASAFGTDLPALVLAFLVLLGGVTLTGSAYALRRNGSLAQYGGPLATRIGEAVRNGIARFRR
jgi:hypothetical protein